MRTIEINNLRTIVGKTRTDRVRKKDMKRGMSNLNSLEEEGDETSMDKEQMIPG